MRVKKTYSNKLINYKSLFGVLGIIVIAITFQPDFFVFRPILFLFKNEGIKGLVINEKNYLRQGHLTNRYTFSYSFVVDGETYKGDTHEEGLIIGDSVYVIYNPIFPIVNRREFDY